MATESSEWIGTLWQRFPGGFTLIWVEFSSTSTCQRFIESLQEVQPSFAEAKGFVDPSSGKVTMGIGGELPRAAIREVIVQGRAFGDEPLTQAFGGTATAALGSVLAELGMTGVSMPPAPSTSPPQAPAPAASDSIRFDCPSCGKRLKAGAQDAGKRAKCSGCGSKVIIPSTSAAPTKVPPPTAAQPRATKSEEPSVAPTPADPIKALFAAVKEGNVSAVDALLKSDPRLVSAKDDGGLLPLANAMDLEHNRFEITALLLQCGADVHTKDRYGDTPVLRVADSTQAQWMQLLLSHGASVNDRNSLGSTPLHLAAARGAPESVRLLIAAGADVNAVNNEAATPVTYATARADVLTLLYAAGAKVSIKALSKAAELGKVEAVKVHLENGCPPNPPAGDDPPLRWAACGWSDDHVRVAELLLAHGADPRIANAAGRRPLDSAKHNNQLPAMIALLERHMST